MRTHVGAWLAAVRVDGSHAGSVDYVAKLEAGQSDPTVGMLQRLAKALGVPVAALLE